MMCPKAVLGALAHADGSASYAWQGYEIVGAINGPVEAQRRDELPEEAFIEVNIRPVSGTGGTRERHLERLVHSTLRSLVLVQLHPRMLIQLTLQILATPEIRFSSAPIPQSASHLPLLPHLLHTAILSLLNANIPLSTTCTAAYVGIDDKDNVKPWPIHKESPLLKSAHVFALTSDGKPLLIESEGCFTVDIFEKAAQAAEDACMSRIDGDVDVEGHESLQHWLRTLAHNHIRKMTYWRED